MTALAEKQFDTLARRAGLHPRVRITAPGWAHGRTGAARPAFGRGRYHVQLDGDRTDYMFDARELEALERGAELR